MPNGGNMATKLKVKESAILGALITVAMLLVNYVLNAFGRPVQGLFAIQPVSPLTGTVGQRVMSWLGGYIPVGEFLGPGTLYLFISAFLAVLVGSWMVGQFNLPVAKGRTGRVASIILYGSAVFYVLIVGLVMQSWGVLLGLAIYVVIAAYAAGFIADMMKISV